MKLRNPFSQEDRLLFDVWICWQCGQNGQHRGGLELHHITGRSSNSPLNGAILCHKCHEKILHTQEEEMELLNKTILYLHSKGYRWTDKDVEFLRANERLIKNNPIANI